VENYRVIRNELETWNEAMKDKKEIIVFSKADICDAEMLEETAQYFEKETGKKVALTISA
jgi:GTPase involved in cell partitioning and DNA repair